MNATRGAGSGTVCKVALINTNTMIPCSRILSRKLTFQKSSQSYHESLEQHSCQGSTGQKEEVTQGTRMIIDSQRKKCKLLVLLFKFI